MLEFFHRYQRSIIVYLFIGILSASMLLFGIDIFSPRAERYAVKINDTEIGYRDLAQRRRQFEDQLRQQFGDSYEQFLAAFGDNLDGRIVEQMIEEELFVQIAEQQHLTVDPGAVQEVIRSIFGDAFSAQTYRSYLQQVGMTAVQFEAQVARDALRAEFQRLLSHFSEASEFEAIQQAQLLESTYTLGIVSVDPEKVRPEVPEPSAEELLTYYEENLLEYEIPARVKYQAVPITPESVYPLVEVYDEDIEMYYAEHQSEFKQPARAKVAHIQINYGEESSPEALLAVKEEAQRIHERSVAGEDFASLAREASDDITTAAAGGSLGWITEGSRDDAVAKAALGLGSEGIADVVETDYGFHVVKVVEFSPQGVSELEEVAGDIRATLRKLEAPGYALVRAEELYENWQQKGESLESFARQEELPLKSSDRFVSAGEVIDPSLVGLTEAVLLTPEESKQLLELGASSVLVEVLEYKEPEVPPFEEVREQVATDLIETRAAELAQVRVQEVINTAASNKEVTLAESAKSAGVSYEEVTDVSRSQATAEPLKEPSIRSSVFQTRSPRLVTTEEPRLIGGVYYAVSVTRVDTPAPADLDKPVNQYQDGASAESLANLRGSLIQVARARSDIDIEPSLLVP